MFLSDKRSKPAPWGFDRGFVDPKWVWFWNSNPVVLPLWEGGGKDTATFQSIGPNRHSYTMNAATWSQTPLGMANNFSSDGEEIEFSPLLSIASWTNMSGFFLVDVDSYFGPNAGFFRTANGGGGTFFITAGGAGLWLRMGGTNTFQASFTL